MVRKVTRPTTPDIQRLRAEYDTWMARPPADWKTYGSFSYGDFALDCAEELKKLGLEEAPNLCAEALKKFVREAHRRAEEVREFKSKNSQKFAYWAIKHMMVGSCGGDRVNRIHDENYYYYVCILKINDHGFTLQELSDRMDLSKEMQLFDAIKAEIENKPHL